MVDIPSEPKLVRMFIRNLLPKYNQHLRFLGLSSFNAVYNIGIDIEDELIRNKASTSNNGNNNWKGKKNDTPSSSSSNSSNYVGSYDLGDILVLDTPKPRAKKPKKVFTPIGMSYDTAFDRLHSKGLITPIGPI